MNNKSTYLMVLVLITTSIFLTGCSGILVSSTSTPPILESPTPKFTATQTITPMPKFTVTQTIIPTTTPTTTPVPQFTVRVMTFNLQDGAGVHPLGSGSSVHMERFADLVELIKSVNPDILGMQEVSGWEYGNPSIIDQFSKEIGMKYYLAHSINNYLHLAIFTKLPILETRNYSNYIGNNGALRAVLQTPLGNKLNVVVVHLDASGHFPHDCQYNKLRRIMEAYTSSPSILMGDTNSLPDSFEAKYLTQGGWELAQSHFIDNIFVLSRQAWSATPICFTTNRNTPGCVLDIGLSDHEPVGATISFYISQNTNYQTFSPTPLPLNGCY